MRRRGRFQVCYSAGFTVSSVLKNTSVSPYPPPPPTPPSSSFHTYEWHVFTVSPSPPSLLLPLPPSLSCQVRNTSTPRLLPVFVCMPPRSNSDRRKHQQWTSLSVCLPVCLQAVSGICHVMPDTQTSTRTRGA